VLQIERVDRQSVDERVAVADPAARRVLANIQSSKLEEQFTVGNILSLESTDC